MQSFSKSPTLLPSISHSETSALFVQLRDSVFQKRPILQQIVAEFGKMSLFDYATYTLRPNDLPIPDERKKQFITEVQSEVERLISPEVGQSIANQLQKGYFASTAEHMIPLSNPGNTQSNILRALPSITSNAHGKNILVLACANISFTNSRFPRGLLFHADYDGELSKEQVTFFGRSADSDPVVHHKPYTMEAFNLIRKRVITMVNERRVKKEIGEKINKLLDEIFKSKDILDAKSYPDQITKANYLLWQKMFPGYEEVMPNLLFVSQEVIALNLIEQYHLDQDTLINKFIFDDKMHDLMIKHCEGITGAFNQNENYGTFLFWAIPPGQRYRVQLWKVGNTLQNADGSYVLPLTPESIRKAIKENQLIPGLLLTFFLLAFYYGVRLMGGMIQTSYLTQMKLAYLAILDESDNTDEKTISEQVETTDMTYVYALLGFMENNTKKRIPATGTDLYLYGNQETLPKMLDIAKNITVEEAVMRAMPTLYKNFYKKDGYDPELLKIKSHYIEKLYGMDKKIQPVASVI